MEIPSISSALQLSKLTSDTDRQQQLSFAALLQQQGLHESQQPSTAARVEPSVDHLDITASSEIVTDQGLPVQANAETSQRPTLKQAFSDFVGQTFFSELIKSYRSTQQPAAYFNGGRAEKIFQGQLDQVLAENLSERSAEKFADPMFEQFMLRRPG